MFKKKPLVLAIEYILYNNPITPREVMEQDIIAHIVSRQEIHLERLNNEKAAAELAFEQPNAGA
jgi:hypothetical protein